MLSHPRILRGQPKIFLRLELKVHSFACIRRAESFPLLVPEALRWFHSRVAVTPLPPLAILARLVLGGEVVAARLQLQAVALVAVAILGETGVCLLLVASLE